MRHGGGMALQRFGATKADRQFCDFQRVKESERLFLSALQIEGKGRSCACAVSLVYIPLSVIFRKAEIDHACRSEEHTSELQSLMRISYAVFCLKKKIQSQHPLLYTFSP